MKNCEIAFYISSHGFGHLTRSLALIEHILKNTDKTFYICTGTPQVEFAKIYLAEFENRVEYFEYKVDVGIVNKRNSLEVDVNATNKAVYEMLDSYKQASVTEAEKLKKMNTRLIISDVSAFACLVSEKSGIKAVEIGNFTWTDQYKSVGADKKIVEKFSEIYSLCKSFIAYDLSLVFSGADKNSVFRSDWLISRPISEKRVSEIRESYSGLYKRQTGNECDGFMYLSLGKSAELPQVKISNFKGVVFYTEGLRFDQKSYLDVLFVRLPNEIKDSQSFVAAADLVIAKAGWSTSAECVVAHSKTLLIERPGVDDDMNTINTLKDRQLASSLTVDEVINLDYQKLIKRAETDIDTQKLCKIQNDTQKVCQKLMSYL